MIVRVVVAVIVTFAAALAIGIVPLRVLMRLVIRSGLVVRGMHLVVGLGIANPTDERDPGDRQNAESYERPSHSPIIGDGCPKLYSRP